MGEDFLKLEYQLCFRLYAVSRNMTRVYSPILESHGLTYPQYIIMLIMFEHPVIDFKELGSTIDLKTGTLTPIIQKMEDIGILEKVKNPEDGRKVNVCLTKQGEDLKEELLHVPRDLAKTIGLDSETYNRMVKDLDLLLMKLNAVQTK